MLLFLLAKNLFKVHFDIKLHKLESAAVTLVELQYMYILYYNYLKKRLNFLNTASLFEDLLIVMVKIVW